MSSKVTATLVVNFNAGAFGGQLSAEIDARPDGLNGGRTQFIAGDEPAFLVFKSNDVTIDSVESSAGSIVSLGGGTILVPEDLQFADVAEASIQKPFYNGFVYKWIGNNLGVPTISEGKVTIAAAGVGILRMSYNALFAAYKVTGIPSPLNGETTFPVLIVVTGTKV